MPKGSDNTSVTLLRQDIGNTFMGKLLSTQPRGGVENALFGVHDTLSIHGFWDKILEESYEFVNKKKKAIFEDI
jgi:hypothetical protein